MRSINLNRQLVGIEDLLIGFGTVMQTRGGQQVQVTKLNAGSLPFDETQSLLQWAKTVNLAELGDIVEELTIVANNKDNIVAVSNNSVNINLVAGLNNEINALYANLVAIQSNYTNITTLIDIYDNMTNLLLIVSQIIPNITEILNVDVLATQVANDKASVATMKLAVETIYDTFDDRFLGSKSTDPTVDNDGNALIDGAMYFDTSNNAMKVYDLGNTVWVTIPQIYLSGLLDVQLTSITTGDLLTWNGTKWVNTRTPKVNSIQLNGGNSTEGILSWNTNEGTANLTLLGGSTLQIGQEEVRTVRNSTASPIPDGTLVMFDGTIGTSGRVKVKPFTGGFSEAHLLYGMTTQLIAANSDGIINIAGKVRGTNTTGSLYGETWVDGDILYAKPDGTGALTKVVPADDKLKLRVAVVVHSHTSGTLEIRFTPFNENMYYTKTQSDALKVPINLSAATGKTTPVDADLIAVSDSDSSFSLKKLSWLNLKATIKTYFDTLFVKKISSSTDNAVVRFNGTTGDVKNSLFKITEDNRLIRYANTTTDAAAINSGAFAGVKPQIQIYTDSTGDAGQLLHIGNFSTDAASVFTRRAGARFTLSHEGSAGESNKSASIYVESTSMYSNNPSLKFEVGNTEKASLDYAGNLLLTSGTGALGYGTGAGGTVTQLTSKSTAVTLNKPTGKIITSNSSLAGGATVTFILNNSLLSSGDILAINNDGYLAYSIESRLVVNGVAYISITNTSVTVSDIIGIRFSIIKGAIA